MTVRLAEASLRARSSTLIDSSRSPMASRMARRNAGKLSTPAGCRVLAKIGPRKVSIT